MIRADQISLAYCVRQLRHAYMQLVNGYVRAANHTEFADGLIAPQIRFLENLMSKSEGPHLGLATNEELINELRARIEVHFPGGLGYRTVDDQ